MNECIRKLSLYLVCVVVGMGSFVSVGAQTKATTKTEERQRPLAKKKQPVKSVSGDSLVLPSAVKGATLKKKPQTAKAMIPKPYYVEIGGMGATMTNSVGVEYITVPKLLALRGGMNLTGYMDVEALLLMNVEDGTVGSNPATQKITQIKSSAGLYAKPKYEVMKGADIFARFGVMSMTVSNQVGENGTPTEVSATGLSYGVGAQYSLSDAMYINGDYMSFYNQDNITVTGVGLYVGYKF